MVIQTVNNFNAMANFGMANPIQFFGQLAITMFALNIISNLPKAEAREAQSVERELCKKLCEPLPGGENDVPEQICTETCEKGGEIIKTKSKEVLKDGGWKTVEILGKVTTPIIAGVDCLTVCSPGAIFTEGGRLAGAGLQYVFGDKQIAAANALIAAAKAVCTAILFTPAGYSGCMVCCGGIKVTGVG